MPINTAVIMRIKGSFVSLEVSEDGIRSNAGDPEIGEIPIQYFHGVKFHN